MKKNRFLMILVFNEVEETNRRQFRYFDNA